MVTETNDSDDVGPPSDFDYGRPARAENEAVARAREDLAFERIETMSSSDIKKRLHELRVHQIELEMQNEELRRTQVELNITRQRYFDLYEFAPVGYCTLNAAGVILQANQTAAALFGAARELLVGKLFFRYVDTLDRDVFYLLGRELAEKQHAPSRELRMVREDGTQFWASLEGREAVDADGSRVLRIVIADISPQKILSLKIQESERLLHGTLDAAMDAIVTVDEQFLVVRFNIAATTMFGVSADRAYGRSLNNFVPNRLRNGHDAHFENFRQEAQTGRTMGNLGQIVGVRADGEEFPIEATISQIEINGKRLFTTILRDCTERKKMEDALYAANEKLQGLISHQYRIKEDERVRIAREIHDELGSMLTGIKANISVAMYEDEQRGMAPNPRLEDVSVLMEAALNTVRKVISDLRPSVLDHLGVWAALEWYVEQTEARSGVKCHLEIGVLAAELDVDEDRSTALFRILQESLTNVTSHAQASRVDVRIQRCGDMIRMEVDDNGKGFDNTSMPGRKSWGIIGMAERARYFGGSIRVVALAPGTRIVLELPLASAE